MAWYPLNGDYKNYTAENMELTQTSTPSYVNGKIGKALNLGGFKWTAEQTAKVLNNEEVSIALWIYVNADEGSTTNRAIIFGNSDMTPSNNRRFSLFQYPNCNSFHWSWQNGNSSSTFTTGALDGVFPSYKWTHLCVTYKNPIGKIYINGELKKTFSGIYNSESFEYETQVIYNSPYHYLNDYRFYNHCLSDAEVKEISKGLVLHYTMDSMYGNSNLLIDSSLLESPSSLRNWSWYRLNSVTLNDYTDEGYHIITPIEGQPRNNGAGLYLNFKELGLTYGDKCTFSFEIKGIIDDSSDGGYFGYMQSNTTYTAQYAYIQPITYFKDILSQDKYIRVSGTFTIKDESTFNENAKDHINLQFLLGYGADVYIKNMKLEKGKILTSWCPNVADSLASDYGLDKIYDSSGFGNDGTPTDLEYSIDREKGLTSTKYNGSTSRILTPKGSFSWFTFDEFTISCWMKPTVSPSTYTGSVGVSYDGGASGKTLCLNNHGGEFCIESVIDSYWITYSSGYTLPINKWSHCVITINKDNIINFYVSGELIKTDTLNFGSITYSNANALFQVGCDLVGGDEYYQGYYDDIRFYTTTLSADDILQLYKEREKIDNQGNLYCSELNEVERKVEYLESNGSQWIDTGIKPNNTTEFEIVTETLKTGSKWDGCLLGSRSSTGASDSYISWFNHYHLAELPSNSFIFGGKTYGWYINGIPEDTSTKHIIKLRNKIFYIDDLIKESITNTQPNSDLPLYLFGLNQGGQVEPRRYMGKLYYCKIWKDGKLVRDFLPIISTEEGHIGEACLFDTVENKYYYNQGTGKFTTNLDESTTNIDFTSKGIVNTDYIIEGNDTVKIKNDGNIIEVNNLYEN